MWKVLNKLEQVCEYQFMYIIVLGQIWPQNKKLEQGLYVLCGRSNVPMSFFALTFLICYEFPPTRIHSIIIKNIIKLLYHSTEFKKRQTETRAHQGHLKVLCTQTQTHTDTHPSPLTCSFTHAHTQQISYAWFTVL